MPYAGFDRADCPLLDLMARLKAETNLEWCGFYLPAPSQSGASWKGRRAALVAQGWGLAPIFVGQQTIGPGAHSVTAVQGAVDGYHASQALRGEGFPPGTWVYLDLENGPPFTDQQKGYVGAWVDSVEINKFHAGVYCSFLFAAEVAALRPSARIWAFHVRTTTPHPVDGTVFPTPDPTTSGYPGASIWQRDDEARLTAFGDLAVDLDVSLFLDPGAPDAAPAVAAISPPSDPLERRKWVQTFLNTHGATLDVDGVFGLVTEAAIADFLAKTEQSVKS